jgi:hypothetical protein
MAQLIILLDKSCYNLHAIKVQFNKAKNAEWEKTLSLATCVTDEET